MESVRFATYAGSNGELPVQQAENFLIVFATELTASSSFGKIVLAARKSDQSHVHSDAQPDESHRDRGLPFPVPIEARGARTRSPQTSAGNLYQTSDGSS